MKGLNYPSRAEIAEAQRICAACGAAQTPSSLTATDAERVRDNWLLKLDVLDQRSAAQNANSAAFSL